MKGTFGRRTAACSVATCALVMLSAAGAFAHDDGAQWTMGGQNLSTWRNQFETEINPQNVAGLKLKWKFTTGGDVSATPAVANGIVYFPDFAGNVYAVDAGDGHMVWQHHVADWTGVLGDFARNDPAIDSRTGFLVLGNQAAVMRIGMAQNS